MCPNETTMPVQVEDVKFDISHITIFCKEILINIHIGSERNRIHLVMTGKEGGDTWPTSNKYSDTLFAEAQPI